jgi:hypothetical protein
MLMLSMWLLGTAFTAALLAADWYIWEPRYRRIPQALDPRPGHRTLADGQDLIYAPSASGREVIATVTAPSLPAEVLAAGKVQGEWMDHRAGV